MSDDDFDVIDESIPIENKNEYVELSHEFLISIINKFIDNDILSFYKVFSDYVKFCESFDIPSNSSDLVQYLLCIIYDVKKYKGYEHIKRKRKEKIDEELVKLSTYDPFQKFVMKKIGSEN